MNLVTSRGPSIAVPLPNTRVAAPWLVYCGHKPTRFPVSSRPSLVSGIILAVATDPKPTQTNTVNGSSPPSSSASKGLVDNNVSTVNRVNDVSKEIKRVRAQMEERRTAVCVNERPSWPDLE
ncbi:hypothetical protein Bca4012_068178 [Brassica carinata]|uniref:Uncharacterized protein n=1 Tax=Brassica carinata TaxID=52824 RepID=A0A8X7VUD5_BRACI|nr:hypothetical protein Bca52824_020407 [Brassica carinata]